MLHDIAEVVDRCDSVRANSPLHARAVSNNRNLESTAALLCCKRCSVDLTASRPLACCDRIVIGGLNCLCAHVFAFAEHDAHPFSHELLSLTLDGGLRLGRLGVEDDDFTDAGGNKSFLRHVEAAKDGKKFTLDLVVGKRSVGIGRLEEETNSFENVDIGINNG